MSTAVACADGGGARATGTEIIGLAWPGCLSTANACKGWFVRSGKIKRKSGGEVMAFVT